MQHLVLIPICKVELLMLNVIFYICHFLEATFDEVTNAMFQCLDTLHISVWFGLVWFVSLFKQGKPLASGYYSRHPEQYSTTETETKTGS